jgi:type III restriction enzyme
MFLYEQIEQAKAFGAYRDLPNYITENLNPALPLRPYQNAAFQNFITYFETPALCQKPTQTLFHMATGSGKTLIMAGLMLYLYKQGYRNFLFFVNLSNIVQKTKENFLRSTSTKYLFAEEIILGGERIPIKEVQNFQSCDENAINICFTTTQGLHSDMWLIKENGVSIEDFDVKKTVLISDEAHHLNVDTRRMNVTESENYRSWEQTVRAIFERNNQNVLLEFTATCDIANAQIRAAYENKIIFDYPLKRFRADLYSKEILTLRSDMSIMDRALQALMLSQYRLKVFEDNRLAIKPVILLKSAKIADSKAFMEEFIETVRTLTGSTLERISGLIDNPTMNKAYAYFWKKEITFEQLAQELKEDFSAEHCVSANDDSEAEKKQLLLNSLEDTDNPYRAIFEVKKLDEGWDVLNLFDIVRLYETRQSGGRAISASTVSEAQLIGRGARYCPFQINDEQPRYQRKYDDDLDNELRICEELHYHCQNDSRYIGELHNALREIGIDPDKVVTRKHILKDEFKKDSLYKEGLIFINDRVVQSRADVTGLLPSVRDSVHTITLSTGASGEDVVMEDGSASGSSGQPNIYIYSSTLGKIAGINYAIINRGLAAYPIFKFKTLKSYFPNLKSTREFITAANYLGNIRIDIRSRYETPTISILNTAVRIVLGKVAEKVSAIDETYEGTKQFKAKNVRDIFSDKTVNYTDPHDGGIGISQNDSSVGTRNRIDLSREDWYAFTDNFGTSEEKAFVAYFKDFVARLKAQYSKVYLVRNERQFQLYSFEAGERFEPDYVLFLQKNKSDGYEQLQIFIEPKGSHLIAGDQWKEDFLLEMKDNAIPVKIFADDNDYFIWGFHFFNTENRSVEFDADFNELLTNIVQYSDSSETPMPKVAETSET